MHNNWLGEGGKGFKTIKFSEIIINWICIPVQNWLGPEHHSMDAVAGERIWKLELQWVFVHLL